MNIRKTAAETLVRAGSPAAVPHLLRRLGRDDDPGLRDALTRALRAVLGEAYAATLLAAAEESRDERGRRLLLAGLDGVPSARARQDRQSGRPWPTRRWRTCCAAAGTPRSPCGSRTEPHRRTLA